MAIKQTYRETERQRDRETERQRDRETERQRDRETERQRDRETERWNNKMDRLTYVRRWIDGKTDIRTYRWIDKQIDGQIDMLRDR